MPAIRSLTDSFNRVSMPPTGWHEAMFVNADNQRIRYAQIPAHTAPGESPRGTIVLTHGYGEFADLYYEAIKEYQAQGFNVWAMDWQGFGGSDRDNPKKPHLVDAQGMNQHVRDLDQFVRTVVQHDKNTPLIMSTHSMGGHPGMLYLQRHPGVFDAAVMSAPMFDIHRLGAGPWARPLVHAIFNAASHIGLQNRPVPALEGVLAKVGQWREEDGRRTVGMHNVREVWSNAVRASAPEHNIARPSFGWINSVYDTVNELNDPTNLRKVTIPVLIGSAGHETLVDNGAHARAVAALPNAKHITLPTAGHSLWLQDEPNYTRWASGVNGFLEATVNDFYSRRNAPTPAPPPDPAQIVTRSPQHAPFAA
ncbi:alpha/beta fold hydrolase [Micavibrio aeruginosavorus]|nr:alpha/beta fold hydrolase [Micavibrio aeruginosavorus]